jgi:hypothetical protein
VRLVLSKAYVNLSFNPHHLLSTHRHTSVGCMYYLRRPPRVLALPVHLGDLSLTATHIVFLDAAQVPLMVLLFFSFFCNSCGAAAAILVSSLLQFEQRLARVIVHAPNMSSSVPLLTHPCYLLAERSHTASNNIFFHRGRSIVVGSPLARSHRKFHDCFTKTPTVVRKSVGLGSLLA